MENIKKMSLSQLSFIVISDGYSVDLKVNANAEIKRRFSKNGCNYDAFMFYEESAIKLRGDNIYSYLIKDNPTHMEYINYYFEYLYKNYSVSGHLLFSEIILFNNSIHFGIIKKVFKNEIKRLSAIIDNNEYDSSYFNSHYNMMEELNEVCEYKARSLEEYLEDLAVNTVQDITTEGSSFMSDKRVESFKRLEESIREEKLLSLPQIFYLLQAYLFDNDILDCMNMQKIALYDYNKLNLQRKSILRSFDINERKNYSDHALERTRRIN